MSSVRKTEKVKQSEKTPRTTSLNRNKETKSGKAAGDSAKPTKKEDKKVKNDDDGLNPAEVNDLVICELCKQDMCSPKHLPCLHTFCETCITKRIEQERQQSTNMHVVCPSCEYQISVPRASDDTKSFAEGLPVSSLVSYLLSKKDLARKKCKQCKNHGRETAADNWCAYCAQTLCDEHLQYHKALTSSRHPIFDVDEILKNPDIGYTPKKCRFHEKEDMKLFCNDHWHVCCNICSKRLHGMCNTCFIEYDTSTIKTHSEITNLKRKLESLSSHTEKMRQDILTNIENLNKQVETEKENIKEFRVQINKHLDKLEEQLQKELESMHTEKLKELEREAKIVDMKHKTSTMYKTMLSVSLKENPNIQSLSTLADIRQNTHRLEDELRLDKYKLQKIGLQVSLSHEIFKNIFKIGVVTPKYARLRNATSPSRQPSTMSKLSSPRHASNVKFNTSQRISQI